MPQKYTLIFIWAANTLNYLVLANILQSGTILLESTALFHFCSSTWTLVSMLALSEGMDLATILFIMIISSLEL